MENMKNSPETLDRTEPTSREYTVRKKKVDALRAAHIDPWPQPKPITLSCAKAHSVFGSDPADTVYSIAGRIMAMRAHGKTMFATIQDGSGALQVYVRADILGDQAFAQYTDYIDIGDIVWFSGPLFITKTGELTLRATDYTLLSKSLHPLPEKFHGLADIETIYRQRYLDLITNKESRDRFIKRSAIIRQIRTYFDEHGFLEVETPMLHPIPGGAAARPFITHHNTLDTDFYLRIAPELYLKRLIIGGFERVYEINRNFRNEGISTRHNPEFTMVEWYVAHQDYYFMMDFIETMIRTIATHVVGTTTVQYGNLTIDLGKPFARLSMHDAVVTYGGIAPEKLTANSIDATCREYNITINTAQSWGFKLLALFEETAEKKLTQPTFITDYPIEISPLTKRDPTQNLVVPRFELFIAGMEISNGYNELNDPFDQAARFQEQASSRANGDEEAHYYDADYILALEHGMPPTVGAGIGIDRLTMLLTNATSIKDVILFPALKKQ